MMTEVMALLISVGAIMVFIVWNQSKKQRDKAVERREVEDSTGKLKQEMERTASEVIGRMENQASALEDLIEESEKNHTILEGRVAELRKLLKRSEGQSTEIRDLLTKLEEAGETVEELQRRLEAAEKKIATYMQMQQVPQMPMQMPMTMQSTMMPMSNPMMTPMIPPPIMTTPLPNVPSPISPPPILTSRANPSVPTTSPESTAKPDTKETISSATKPKTASVTSAKSKTETSKATAPPPKRDKADIKRALQEASAEQEKAEPKDFEKVLARSMANDKSNVNTISVPDRHSIVVPSRQRITVVNSDEPVKIENKTPSNLPKVSSTSSRMTSKNNSGAERVSNSAKIKDLLLEGLSVEDIARETGMGRGAIELVQEMTRRQLERK